MNTQQIDAILRNDFMTKHEFQGVFPVDKLPLICDGMYVINTDEHDEPGEHWIAVYNKEYFDSYGIPPQDRRIVSFIGTNAMFNAVPLQQPLSNACGFYCIYYLIERARGKSMEDIIDVLKNSDSDFIVKRRIYDYYSPLFH